MLAVLAPGLRVLALDGIPRDIAAAAHHLQKVLVHRPMAKRKQQSVSKFLIKRNRRQEVLDSLAAPEEEVLHIDSEESDNASDS